MGEETYGEDYPRNREEMFPIIIYSQKLWFPSLQRKSCAHWRWRNEKNAEANKKTKQKTYHEYGSRKYEHENRTITLFPGDATVSDTAWCAEILKNEFAPFFLSCSSDMHAINVEPLVPSKSLKLMWRASCWLLILTSGVDRMVFEPYCY